MPCARAAVGPHRTEQEMKVLSGFCYSIQLINSQRSTAPYTTAVSRRAAPLSQSTPREFLHLSAMAGTVVDELMSEVMHA